LYLPSNYYNSTITLQDINQIIGAVRFRQLRVKADSCTVSKEYREFQPVCFAAVYTAETKDKEPFGPPENDTK
jgi:hypothetical protein